MKKAMVCIFAHPDDESFGPSGTIHKYTKTHDVYIICATNGDAGQNHLKDSKDSLGVIRQKEISSSAKSLGVKKVFFLNHNDATLNNLQYHEIAGEVITILDDLRPEILMTYEPRGISGHIDHITISMITSYVFEKLSYVKTLLYYCLTEEYRAQTGEYFIYFPPGYSSDEIHKTVDISDIIDIKKRAMLMHESQTHDVQRLLKNLPNRTEEHFLVKTK